MKKKLSSIASASACAALALPLFVSSACSSTDGAPAAPISDASAPGDATPTRPDGDAAIVRPPSDGAPPGDSTSPVDTYVPKPCTGASGTPRVLCVDARTAGTQDGTAAHPYASVQAAVDVAATGDVVQVAGGEYVGNVRVAAKSVALVGGFAGAPAATYASGGSGEFLARDVAANVTTIRGTGGDAAIHLQVAGASLVSGFRITGGTGHPEGPRWAGGGVYCDGGSPTVSFNVIEDNDIRHGTDMARGGGVNVDNSEAQILSNVIRRNHAMRGAGIAVSGSRKVALRGNVVSKNIGIDDHGGGIFASGPDLMIGGNLVEDNEIGRALDYGWGGGIYIHDKGTVARLSGNRVTANYAPSIGSGVFIDNEATAYLDHELIYQNKCATRGGALYVDGLDSSGTTGSNVFVSFTTIADNDCPIQGGMGAGGVYVEGDSKLTIKSSILSGNGSDIWSDATSTVTVAYSLAASAVAGTGNVVGDPLFVDSARADYHVRSKGGHFDPAVHGGRGGFVKDTASSPTVDAADPAEDASREPAPNGGRANMGAHGNTPEASLSES